MDTLRLEAVCLLKIKEHKDLELRIGTTKISQVPLINYFGHDTSVGKGHTIYIRSSKLEMFHCLKVTYLE